MFFFHFVLTFLFKDRQYRKLINLNYLVGLLFIIGVYSGSYMLKGIAPKSTFDIWVDAGILYPIYVIYFLLLVLLSYHFLHIGYKNNDGIKRRQILIIFWATLIGFGGGMTNFLPQLFNIYPFGTFVIFLHPILITYGIFLKDY